MNWMAKLPVIVTGIVGFLSYTPAKHQNLSFLFQSVFQWTDADGLARSDEGGRICVVQTFSTIMGNYFPFHFTYFLFCLKKLLL